MNFRSLASILLILCIAQMAGADNDGSDFERAFALRVEGKSRKALEALQSVPPQSPDYVRAQVQLGATLEDLGNYKEAEKTYLGVLAVDPRNGAARRNLENLNVAKAVKTPLSGPNPGKDSILDAGLRALEANDCDRAIQMFRMFRGLFPNDTRPVFYSGLAMERRGFASEAQAIYESVLRMDSSHMPARVNLVILLMERGDRQRARKVLNSAAAVDKDPRARYLTRILGGPDSQPASEKTASVSPTDKVTP
jgi:Flp pilus assembly protein TadD